MTIVEAINTAIMNLEAVTLPIRDGNNATRVRNALYILDALRENAVKQQPVAEEVNESEEEDLDEIDPEE